MSLAERDFFIAVNVFVPSLTAFTKSSPASGEIYCANAAILCRISFNDPYSKGTICSNTFGDSAESIITPQLDFTELYY